MYISKRVSNESREHAHGSYRISPYSHSTVSSIPNQDADQHTRISAHTDSMFVAQCTQYILNPALAFVFNCGLAISEMYVRRGPVLAFVFNCGSAISEMYVHDRMFRFSIFLGRLLKAQSRLLQFADSLVRSCEIVYDTNSLELRPPRLDLAFFLLVGNWLWAKVSSTCQLGWSSNHCSNRPGYATAHASAIRSLSMTSWLVVSLSKLSPCNSLPSTICFWMVS